MKQSILLLGSGGHFRSCVDVIEGEGRYHIGGVVERSGAVPSETCRNYPLLGDDDDLPELRKTYQFAFIAVGHVRIVDIRTTLYHRLKALDFTLPVVRSSSAYIARNATVAEGAIVMHGAIVNAAAGVGANCIINTRALVEHDARIGDHCHIAPGAIVNGGVTVGSETFIGSGAVTNHGITIGSGCFIGAGALVKNSIPDHTVLKR